MISYVIVTRREFCSYIWKAKTKARIMYVRS